MEYYSKNRIQEKSGLLMLIYFLFGQFVCTIFKTNVVFPAEINSILWLTFALYNFLYEFARDVLHRIPTLR